MSPEEMTQGQTGVKADTTQTEKERRRKRGLQRLQEGARLLSQRRAKEAANILEQAAELLPDNADVAINLGGAYILQHRYDQAVSILERAGELAPENVMVWTNLAAAYLGRLETSGPKQQERAIQAYERALLLDPQTPHVHYNLGLIYKDRQDWERAQSHFQAAVEADPTDKDARDWLDRLASLKDSSGNSPADGPSQQGAEA